MIQYIENTNLAYCDGYKFRKDKKSGYWLCTTLHKRLHIYIWEKNNGEIPKGYEVHHIDKNKDNNEIDNLQLLTKKEHSLLHGRMLTDEQREQRRINLDVNARPKAVEWHKTEEAKKWHKKHYEQMKDKMHVLRDFKCIQCGKDFKSEQVKSKFCCNACKSKWRRNSEVDNIKTKCVICGKEFNTNKYRPAKTCSRSCARKLSWLNKKGQ